MNEDEPLNSIYALPLTGKRSKTIATGTVKHPILLDRLGRDIARGYPAILYGCNWIIRGQSNRTKLAIILFPDHVEY